VVVNHRTFVVTDFSALYAWVSCFRWLIRLDLKIWVVGLACSRPLVQGVSKIRGAGYKIRRDPAEFNLTVA